MSTFSPVAEQPAISEAPASTPFTRTTLGEWGRQLPIGILHEGALHRNFTFKRFTAAQEREIEIVKREKKGMGQPDFVLEVLSRMVTQLGPHNFESMRDVERRVVLQSLWMADIFVLWVWLRIDAMGNDVKFRMTCRGCREDLKPEVSLEDIDVKVVDSVSQLTWPYALRDGLILSGAVEKNLILQPPRWSVLLGDKNRKTAIVDLKVSVSIGAIRRAGDGTKSAGRKDFDEMTKFDLEHLQREVDDHSPGIEMEFSTDCDKCGTENRYGFDWTYDFFFTASSL